MAAVKQVLRVSIAVFARAMFIDAVLIGAILLVVPVTAMAVAPVIADVDSCVNESATSIAEPVFQRLAVAAQQVKTLRSDFIQEKYLTIFNEKLISSGQFYYQKPDKLRWEILQPVGSGFVLDGDAGRRWHQRIAGSEAFKLDQDPAMALIAEQLFAWAKADIGWLQQHYKISVEQQQPVRLKLLPPKSDSSDGENRQFLAYLLITFNASDSFVETVEIHEIDGDYTRINFNNSTVNTELNKSIFIGRLVK